jgi:MFS family permease
MLFSKRLNRLRAVYHEFPRQFWIIIVCSFIDNLGGALMFPFFTLYITQKFAVGMTQVGVLFGLFSFSSVVGSVVGGALADRFGRKGMLLFGLVMSALSSLLMGVVGTIELFFLVTLGVGLLANAGNPARQAMVADVLPEDKRAQGFGILRVVANLSVTIGPLIGGLLASRSFMLLFICDAVASLITAGIAYVALEETRPAGPEEKPQETMVQAFGGYLDVARDAAFLWFLVSSALMVLVYMQMNTTLAVYLRDSHGVTAQYFGYILSLNAAMVVLFQFPITRLVSRFRPLLVMAVGTVLYALGFGMYGVVSIYPLFLLAMVIITVGEMLVSPVGQAIVAQLAPEDKRGRYLATYGFSWVIPTAIGPLLAGVVMDNLDPNWVWYGAALVGLVAAAAFALQESLIARSTWATIDRRLDIIEMVEQNEVSAAEAVELLQAVQEGRWASLAGVASRGVSRHLRIRVSDQISGAMKFDMSIPLGLVNTVIYMEGRLAAGLESIDLAKLQEVVAASAADEGVATMNMAGGGQIEVSLEQ